MDGLIDRQTVGQNPREIHISGSSEVETHRNMQSDRNSWTETLETKTGTSSSPPVATETDGSTATHRLGPHVVTTLCVDHVLLETERRQSQPGQPLTGGGGGMGGGEGGGRTAGSLVQQEKGTPHFSRLGFPSVQLK